MFCIMNINDSIREIVTTVVSIAVGATVDIMNIYTIVFVFLIICGASTGVLIDGEMSFDVQILNDNNNKNYIRQVLNKSEKQKRKKEGKERYIAQKGKIFQGIYEIDHLLSMSSKKDKVKADDKQKEEEKGGHNNVTGTNDVNSITTERHAIQERKVNGKIGVDQMELSKEMITKAEQLQCVYQYPEKKQMEALLSDMMNQLTRLIVTAHEYSESNVDNVGNMSAVGDVNDRSETVEVHGVSDARRSDKRFRVVNDRSPAAFETVFKQLVHKYQNFYNTILQNINRSLDPCDHQREIKKIWQELLAQSQHMLHRSTLATIEQLFPRNRADDSSDKALTLMLQEELTKIRSEQLDLLCEHFQLCYNDLL